jgi:hypothetical protein
MTVSRNVILVNFVTPPDLVEIRKVTSFETEPHCSVGTYFLFLQASITTGKCNDLQENN